MRSSCKAFSQLVIKGGGPLVGGAISGLIVLVIAAAIRGLNRSLEKFDTAQLRIPGGDSP